MVGIFWMVNLVFSAIELLAGLFLVILYTRSATRVRTRTALLLALLGLSILSHATLSLAASMDMIGKGLGPEAAIPLMPVNMLGAVIAVLIASIAYR
ncbi:MAG: hypothetical protein LRS43_02180 [Desulfurococcales archaeon]|nr:hypothetical protein [Desulfurococcales archaeon]